jgi:predicted DNA-binding transcriptional regulator YafY
MAQGTQIERSYRLIQALLQGEVLGRHEVAALLGVKPAAADRHIKAITEMVSGIELRKRRNRPTIRLVKDASAGVAPNNLAAAACFSASLARLFRGTAYESRLDEVRDSVTRRARKPQEFAEARRKFLFVTPAGEFALPERQGILDELVDAVLRQLRVHIEYTGFNGELRRVDVSPLSIAIYSHQLYLLAEGEGVAVRTYRLSRIRRLRLLAKTFAYPTRSAYDPEQMFRDTFGIFVRDEYPVEDVVLHLAPHWRTYAHHHSWHSSQKVSDGPDGRVVLRLRVRTCPEFQAFVLGFGAEVEVLQPASLRDRIAKQARALLRTYGDEECGAAPEAPRSRRASRSDVLAAAAASSGHPSGPDRRRARGTKPHSGARS